MNLLALIEFTKKVIEFKQDPGVEKLQTIYINLLFHNNFKPISV